MEKILKIYYTSDVHGYLFPNDYINKEEKAMGILPCAAGFKKDGNTLIIDGGDMLQGSPLAYYCQMKRDNSVLSEAMNICGYDIVTTGNHDFNYGAEYLEAYTEALEARCVCQNIEDTKEGAHPFTWVKRRLENGLTVGVAGIVTEFVNVWEKPKNLGKYKVEACFPAAKKALEEMKGEVDITICVYHGGFEVNVDSGEVLETSGENVGYKICRELDFDLFLTGHQHMCISGRELFGTYAVQPSCHGRVYCEIEVSSWGTEDTCNLEASCPLETSCNQKLKIKSNMCTPDIYTSKTERFPIPQALSQVGKRIAAWLDEPVGCLERELLPEDKLSMALHGSPIADLINDIQRTITEADISCTSLANEISGFHREVTVRDILMTYPFPNTLAVIEVTGRVLKEALERSAEYFFMRDGAVEISKQFLQPKIEHYNYDYFYGVTFDRDLLARVGERITNIKVKGCRVHMEDRFSLCLNNYRASGSGGYTMYAGCKVLWEGTKEIAEQLIEYFQSNMKS